LPFERLGEACRAATPGPSEALALGAFELSWPLAVVTESGGIEPARRPREWKGVAQLLVLLQRRWAEQLGLADDTLAAALDVLDERVRGLAAKGKLAETDAEAAAGLRVRAALLGTEAPESVTRVLLAPTRAHYVALLGAEGLAQPAQRDCFWSSAARRSVAQPLSDATLVLALVFGPASLDARWFEGQALAPDELRQQLVHHASHLLSRRSLPSAPAWLHEALSIRDSVALAGADETLCSGHRERDPSFFDHSPAAMWSFALANTQRSPYRGKASRELFADALRAALADDGFEIRDLARSRPALVARGPFLGASARVPDEVLNGPDGLREGFAEFFRAYCTAFVEWLSHERAPGGTPLLAGTLGALRVPVAPPATPRPGLEAALRALDRRTLGASSDPEQDLEAAFCAWLRAGL
jgi:hypothetical protein